MGRLARTLQPPPAPRPASTDPPTAAARSRIPRSPLPGAVAVAASPSAPSPSSETSIVTASGSRRTSTRACEACACRATLVSASCTIRYPVECSDAGRSATGRDLELDVDAGVAQPGGQRLEVVQPR